MPLRASRTMSNPSHPGDLGGRAHRRAPATDAICEAQAVPDARFCANHHPDVGAMQTWLGLGPTVRGLAFDEPDLRLTAFEADRGALAGR
jgi:hypothetical protein